jgi:hypothetical protein
MDVNDDAGNLDKRGAFDTIASRLAPTGDINGLNGSVLLWICVVYLAGHYSWV